MKKILSIFFLTIIFTACSDDFLDTTNKNALDTGSFFQTENDLLLAVNTAYTPFAHGGMFGHQYFFRLNTLDPYIWFETPKAGFDQMIINTSDFKATWEDLYRGLFRTSDILANMGRLKNDIEPAVYKQYEGQLKALRGMYYFYLVVWFNEPIYYDETNIPENPMIGLPNGTPEQFWDKLEEDLTSAAASLPASWEAKELGRMTSGTANAALGKALLYKHFHYYLRFGIEEGKADNLTKAKKAFLKVKDSGQYELIQPMEETKEDYQAALLSNYSYLDIPVGSNLYKAENNKESVWEIQYNDDDRAAGGWLPGWQWGGNLNYMYFGPFNFRNHEIDPNLWYEYETAGAPAGYDRDPRAYATCYLDGDLLDWREDTKFESGIHSKNIVVKNNLFNGPMPNGSESLGMKKYYFPQFKDKSSPNSAPFNVRVIRYADVLLMLAETSYLIDQDADGSGLAAINEVRARAGMPAIAEVTPEAIIHERICELSTEGHHYMDLVRWMYDTDFPIDYVQLFQGNFNPAKNYCFPIPQSDINANKGILKQNPGW